MAWQIAVMPDTFNLFRVTVSADCFTSELFEKIKDHPQAPKSNRYQLTTSDEIEVESSNEKRLSDYDIRHGSTLSLVVGLHGGVWPKEEDLEGRPRNLIPSSGLRTTTAADNPDILGLDDNSLRAVMPCGHAIAPLSLTLHCYYELDKGEHEILCPDAKCRKKWTFALIRDAACLTPDELQEFERKALLNRFKSKSKEMKPCPKCHTFSSPTRPSVKRLVCGTCTSRLGRNYEFCWLCLQDWKTGGVERCGNLDCEEFKPLLVILAKCPDKEIIEGVKSPSKRACPKCFIIIEHLDKCKHMTCSKCKYEFCFICLNAFPCGTCTFQACTVAPRQTSATFKTCTIAQRQTSATEGLGMAPDSSIVINPIAFWCCIAVIIIFISILLHYYINLRSK